MPFPCIPAIYLRDALSFLKRIEMDKMRLVSCRIDDVITDLPIWKLPKYRLKTLHFAAIWNPRSVHIGEDGYASGPCFMFNNPKDWRELSKSWGCCLELKESSLQFVGQLLCTEAEPHSVFRLSVVGKRGKIEMRAVNRMTETTAFDILHLLHHLHDVSFRFVLLSAVPAFPRLLQVLSNFCYGVGNGKRELLRLYTSCIHYDRSSSIMDGGELAMADIFHVDIIGFYVEGEGNLSSAFGLIAAGGRHCRRLRLIEGPRIWLNNTHLRAIVKHFEHSPDTLRGIIPCVEIVPRGSVDWLATFPEKDAVEISPRVLGQRRYEFTFTHTPSGRPFRLTNESDMCCHSLGLRLHFPAGTLR